MASSDYISREAANQIIAAQCGECADACLEFDGIQPDCNQCLLYGAKKAIESIPAADVVEVVRCSECKYSEHWYRDKRLCRLWYGEENPSAPIDVFDDGFCNYGERREDDG